MFEELKKFVATQLADAERLDLDARQIRNTRAVAFGAVEFALILHPEMWDEINSYWEEQWEKFYQLERSRYLR
jgi:hypothetical protein